MSMLNCVSVKGTVKDTRFKNEENKVGRVIWGYIVFEYEASAFEFYPKNSEESFKCNGRIQVLIRVI